MSAENVARILTKMLVDEQFNDSLDKDPERALADYESDLTEEEWQSLMMQIAPEDVEPLMATPRVGAWRYLAQHIDELPSEVREDLNRALAERAAVSPLIPVTGE
jgi:hypothetical protein